VFKTKPQKLKNFRHRIVEENALIEPDFIRNAVTSYDQIAQCQIINGVHFEQLL